MTGTPLALPAELTPPEVLPEPATRPPLADGPPPAAALPPARPAAPLPSDGPQPLPVVESVPQMEPVAETPRARAASTLEVVYRNRLKSAILSVSIDGGRVWTRDVATPANFFKRAIGQDVWTTLAVPPGEHVVDVRITGSGGKLDLVRQTSTTFEAGGTHRLRVVLIPPKTLRLTWKELHSD